MRVLVIHNGARSDLPSGETVVFRDEVEALRAANVEVDTLLHVPSRAEHAWQRWLVGARLLGSRQSYRLVRQAIEQYRPQVVHAHSILPDLTVSALTACRDAGVPVVQTLHNYRWLCVEGGLFRDGHFCRECIDGNPNAGRQFRCARHSWLASALLTENNRRQVRSGRLFNIVSRFLAVSHFARKQHIDAGFPADRIIVKYNGVAVPSASEIVPREQRENTICFAGRLDGAKGTALLRQLVEISPHWRWCVMGTGPEEPMWRALQQQLPDDRLELTGTLDRRDVRRRIARARLTIVPSLVPETFGLVAAESLASGTPVVASHLGGLIELVAGSGGGRTVSTELGVAEYHAAIVSLMEDTRAWDAASRAAYDFARQNLAMDDTTAQLRSIYAQVSRQT